MLLQDIMEDAQLQVCAGAGNLQQTVASGYTSDLLSNVMGKAPEKAVWVTLQTHVNIVAVAVLVGIVGIIVAGGQQPTAEAIAKAEEEGIVIFTTELSAFEVVGRLYQLGVRGI